MYLDAKETRTELAERLRKIADNIEEGSRILTNFELSILEFGRMRVSVSVQSVYGNLEVSWNQEGPIGG